jgi:hypothetical protein
MYLISPVLNQLEEKFGKDLNVVYYKYLTHLVLFIMALIFAIPIFMVYMVPTASDTFKFALFNALSETE